MYYIIFVLQQFCNQQIVASESIPQSFSSRCVLCSAFPFQMAESSFSFIFHGAGFSEAAVQSG